MKSLLIFSIYVFSLKTAPVLNKMQNFMVTIINDVRTSPESFSKFLETKLLNKFKGKIFDDILETNEGSSCLKELSKKLQIQQSLFPFEINPFLSSLAEKHSIYMKEQNEISHYQDGFTPFNIVSKKGNLTGDIIQVVFKINKNLGSLITSLAFLLCDDGYEMRSNQKALLNENYDQIGIGGIEDQQNFFLTILIANNFTPNQSFQKEVENYKAIPNFFDIMNKDQEKISEVKNQNSQENTQQNSQQNTQQNIVEEQQEISKVNTSDNIQTKKSKKEKILALKELYKNLDDLTFSVDKLNQFKKNSLFLQLNFSSIIQCNQSIQIRNIQMKKMVKNKRIIIQTIQYIHKKKI